MYRSIIIISCVFIFLIYPCLSVAENSNNNDMQQLKNELVQQFKIELINSKHSDRWRVEDILAIKSLMESLPVELQKAASLKSKKASIKLFKNHSYIRPCFQHGAGLLSFDKINIIDEPAFSSTALFFGLEKPCQTAVARQLLYYLLCVYDSFHYESRSSKWMKISGWKHRKFLNYRIPFLNKKANNQDPRAYALASGMQNPSEDFLTTALFFFIPPDTTIEDSIKCRTPEKYQFIKTLFPSFISPLDQPYIQCHSIDDGFLDDLEFYDPNSGDKIDMGPVNTDTVDGFEILCATPGVGDASEIAGHLVLRIKLNNNPRAKQLGVENPHDLVISFLADTEAGKQETQAKVREIQLECKKNWFNLVENNQSEDALESIIQSLKGLSGGFLTIMDRQTLSQTIKSYTIEQDRDLLRYKLNLTQEQKKQLLDRLYLAKKNYKAKYYFFSQNCASVLIKVVAQGIKDYEIANFDPLVSPPNTLLGLMIRKGLATPVYPSFYSYRKQGYIAQEIIKKEYGALIRQFSELNFPELSDLLGKDETIRSNAMIDIAEAIKGNPATWQKVYRLATLVQEAEMAFSYKDMICENYTSPVTADARRLQQYILEVSGRSFEEYRVHTDRLIEDAYMDTEKSESLQGYPHTKHSTYSFGAGYDHSDVVPDAAVMVFEAALHHQDMGSISSIAMQRGSYVDLGKVAIMFADGRSGKDKLRKWQITALSLRKFKERLGSVPGCFEPAGHIGLGLTAFDFEGSKDEEKVTGTLVGGELLANIISSSSNNNFLFVSAGADINYYELENRSNVSLNIPVRAESLLTFDQKRRWQWRNDIEYSIATRDDVSDELKLSSYLAYRLGEIKKHEILFIFSVDYRKEYSNSFISESREALTSLFQIEVNHW